MSPNKKATLLIGAGILVVLIGVSFFFVSVLAGVVATIVAIMLIPITGMVISGHEALVEYFEDKDRMNQGKIKGTTKVDAW